MGACGSPFTRYKLRSAARSSTCRARAHARPPPCTRTPDVINREQARLSEDAGAVAVMALERVPADIRASGGVARSSDPEMILGIKAEVRGAGWDGHDALHSEEGQHRTLCPAASQQCRRAAAQCVCPCLSPRPAPPPSQVTIPVMAKARIGHFVEAQVLGALEVDFIDESEVLSMADDEHHIDKTKFKVRAGASGGGASLAAGPSPTAALVCVCVWWRAGPSPSVCSRGPHPACRPRAGALCVRLPQLGRGAAAHCGGRGDAAHQGRGGHGQRRRGRAPRAHREPRDQARDDDGRHGDVLVREGEVAVGVRVRV